MDDDCADRTSAFSLAFAARNVASSFEASFNCCTSFAESLELEEEPDEPLELDALAALAARASRSVRHKLRGVSDDEEEELVPLSAVRSVLRPSVERSLLRLSLGRSLLLLSEVDRDASVSADVVAAVEVEPDDEESLLSPEKVEQPDTAKSKATDTTGRGVRRFMPVKEQEPSPEGKSRSPVSPPAPHPVAASASEWSTPSAP